ncbi:glycosyltransferase, partial [Aquiluna sp.]|nr:glycosyltransferase [Aquiluna sp.]
YLDNKGVAKSRNSAIENANGTYLLFGDDDVTFDAAEIQKALDYLDQNPKVSLVLASAVDESGELRKTYPLKKTELNRFNSAKAATYEMILRVEHAKDLNVRFDEDFGAGARNYLGDEYIFIVDLIKAGGKAIFLPLRIATHPADSSGSRWGEKQDRIARAIVFTRVFGKLAVFVRAGFAFRRLRELGSLSNALRFTFGR